MNTKIFEAIKKFQDFSGKEIPSAVGELKRIETERNRKHLQKLVYVDIVNRFDVLVDTLLVICSTQNDNDFSGTVLNRVRELPVYSKDLYEILLADNIKESAEKKVHDIVRVEFLNERHSKKVRILLKNCFNFEDKNLDRPRVDANDGRIMNSYTQRENNVPPSIIGYADYLYSRRNVLVHGGESSGLMPNDLKYLKKTFNIKKPAKVVGIRLSSIESASTFYNYLCDEIRQSFS